MSKTQKPLRIAVDNALMEMAEVADLAAKGHEIVPTDHQHFDLVIGPKCWNMDEILIKYMELAIKAVRGVKYVKKEKK